MKRDMDLVRLILLEIEEKHKSTALIDLSIDGYDMQTVAYHCEMLHEKGLVSSYKAGYAGNKLYIFSVGSLTWEGHDFLDKIRDNSTWKKTKDVIAQKGLPLIFDTIKTIADAFITAAAEGVANSIIKNGGV